MLWRISLLRRVSSLLRWIAASIPLLWWPRRGPGTTRPLAEEASLTVRLSRRPRLAVCARPVRRGSTASSGLLCLQASCQSLVFANIAARAIGIVAPHAAFLWTGRSACRLVVTWRRPRRRVIGMAVYGLSWLIPLRPLGVDVHVKPLLVLMIPHSFPALFLLVSLCCKETSLRQRTRAHLRHLWRRRARRRRKVRHPLMRSWMLTRWRFR